MGGLIVAGVVVVVALLVVAALVSSRKRVAARRQRVLAMGFEPLAQQDPELVRRLQALRRKHGGGSVTVQNVFRRDDPDCRLYVLDTNTSGGEESTVSEEVVVLVSPHLDLPGFTLFPKVPGSGFLANMANQVVESLLARSGASSVEFPSYPAFGKRYALLSDSEAEARALFTDAVLAHLSETGSCIVEAEGDTLMLARLPQARGGAGHGRLEESLREAVLLLDLMRT